MSAAVRPPRILGSSWDGEQVTRKVYLTSYDRYDEVLEYDTETGASKLMRRSGFERLRLERTFGTFTREDERVLGVFASPQGPVLFLDGQRVLARFGEVSASVAADGSQRSFTLSARGKRKLRFDYQERHGAGTNPYDNEPEDVDLGSMIAAGIRKEQFFKNYTRDWV
jgi:hypothetical protein